MEHASCHLWKANKRLCKHLHNDTNQPPFHRHQYHQHAPPPKHQHRRRRQLSHCFHSDRAIPTPEYGRRPTLIISRPTLGSLLLLIRHGGIASLLLFARVISLLPFTRLSLAVSLIFFMEIKCTESAYVLLTP